MTTQEPEDDLRPNYDLTRLRVRRTGAGRTHAPTLTVALDPDVAAVFTTPEAVNRALRAFIAAIPPGHETACLRRITAPPTPPHHWTTPLDCISAPLVHSRCTYKNTPPAKQTATVQVP